MKFGVFDHLDLSGSPIERFYRERLALVEAYERAASTPTTSPSTISRHWAWRPSPSVFLAAVAQAHERAALRSHAVYVPAPLYHPLRLLEEVGMLDR